MSEFSESELLTAYVSANPFGIGLGFADTISLSLI